MKQLKKCKFLFLILGLLSKKIGIFPSFGRLSQIICIFFLSLGQIKLKKLEFYGY